MNDVPALMRSLVAPTLFMTLLLAEDDPELARQVVTHFHAAGHGITNCADGESGLRMAQEGSYDALILDVNLPKLTGFQIVEKLRAAGVLVPVILLTARTAVADRVAGLAAGADDYLTKPFAMEELAARLDALYRRANQSSAPTVNSALKTLGAWTLDTRQRRLKSADGEVIDLQPRECALLDLFIEHTGRILTKKYLLDKVWDIRFDPGTNVVDAMICRLRRKIDTTERPSFIQTIRGQGYVFKVSP
jgi:DNA-binding response OmpR family regulator